MEMKSRLVVVRGQEEVGMRRDAQWVRASHFWVMKMPEMKMVSGTRQRWWLYNTVNVLNTTELSMLK